MSELELCHRGHYWKMNEKRCAFFAAAQDVTAGFVIANGKSGPVAELFVLTEANKRLNKQTIIGT